MVSCGHGLYAACVQRLTKNKILYCPVCRHECRVQPVKNHDLISVLDVSPSSMTDSDRVPITGASSSPPPYSYKCIGRKCKLVENSAVVYCTACGGSLCGACML